MHTLGTLKLYGYQQPTSIESSSEATFAEHARLQGKPALQMTGEKNDTVTLTFALHQSQVQPETFIAQLHEWRKAGEVLPLGTEAGDQLGEFVITSVTESRTASAPDGSIVSANVTVSLLEWASVDGVAERTTAARRDGFAVGTTGQPIGATTQAVESQAMESTMQVGGQNEAIDTSLISAIADPDIEPTVRITARERLTKIVTTATEARTLINSLGGQRYTDTRGMETDLLAVIAGAQAMQAIVDTATIPDLRTALENMRVLDAALKASAQSLAKYIGR